MVLSMWLSGVAMATTYTLTGTHYSTVLGAYTTAMSTSGTFTTAAPLPANAVFLDISLPGTYQVTAWSFFDGVYTFTNANSAIAPAGGFGVSTDAKGNIIYFYIVVASPPPPNSLNQVMNFLDFNTVGPYFTLAGNQGTCTQLTGNQCTGDSSSTNTGFATTIGSAAPNFAALAPTITLSFNPTSVTINGTASAIFTVDNPDASSAVTGVAFADTLPAGLFVATPNGLSSSCGGAANAVEGSNTIALAGASLGPSMSCTVTVNVAVTKPGTFTDTTGTVTSSDSLAGIGASATLHVSEAPATPVPTLQQWALWLMALLITVAGALAIARRSGKLSRSHV